MIVNMWQSIKRLIRFWWWSVKRFTHFWFGKKPKIESFGDFYTINYVINSEVEKINFKQLYLKQLVDILKKLKGEVDKNRVIVTYVPAVPYSRDPLQQVSIVTWKCNIILHTRKTWKEYVKSLLVVNINIKFKQ